jgi:hypothetical protein
MFLARWLLCAFLNCFPVDITVRVWDALLIQGREAPRLLLEVALAVIFVCRDDLLRCQSFVEAAEILKSIGSRICDSAELLLLTRAPQCCMRSLGIDQWRQQYAPQFVSQAMAEAASTAASSQKQMHDSLGASTCLKEPGMEERAGIEAPLLDAQAGLESAPGLDLSAVHPFASSTGSGLRESAISPCFVASPRITLTPLAPGTAKAGATGASAKRGALTAASTQRPTPGRTPPVSIDTCLERVFSPLNPFALGNQSGIAMNADKSGLSDLGMLGLEESGLTAASNDAHGPCASPMRRLMTGSFLQASVETRTTTLQPSSELKRDTRGSGAASNAFSPLAGALSPSQVRRSRGPAFMISPLAGQLRGRQAIEPSSEIASPRGRAAGTAAWVSSPLSPRYVNQASMMSPFRQKLHTALVVDRTSVPADLTGNERLTLAELASFSGAESVPCPQAMAPSVQVALSTSCCVPLLKTSVEPDADPLSASFLSIASQSLASTSQALHQSVMESAHGHQNAREIFQSSMVTVDGSNDANQLTAFSVRPPIQAPGTSLHYRRPSVPAEAMAGIAQSLNQSTALGVRSARKRREDSAQGRKRSDSAFSSLNSSLNASFSSLPGTPSKTSRVGLPNAAMNPTSTVATNTVSSAAKKWISNAFGTGHEASNSHILHSSTTARGGRSEQPNSVNMETFVMPVDAYPTRYDEHDGDHSAQLPPDFDFIGSLSSAARANGPILPSRTTICASEVGLGSPVKRPRLASPAAHGATAREKDYLALVVAAALASPKVVHSGTPGGSVLGTSAVQLSMFSPPRQRPGPLEPRNM